MFKYRRDIDGLRAFSVLIVILYHAFPQFLKNGYVGVDIFFVISGYLISSLTWQDLQSGQFSILNFYLRRIKRIFPVALIVLFFTTVVAVLTLHWSEFARFQTSLAGASLFYVNYVLEGEHGYFNLDNNLKPLMHYWSLAVEEQFYILWPMGLLLLSRVKNKKWILNLLAGLFVYSLGWFFYTNYFNSVIADGTFYFSLEVRAWELLSGIGITYATNSENIRKYISKFNENSVVNFANAGVFLLVTALIIPALAWINLVAVTGAVCILLNRRENYLTKFLSTKLMVGIGLISYSLYLWHWPFLSFLRIYNPDAGNFALLLAVIAGTVLAVLTYFLVERPLKNQSWAVRADSPQQSKGGLYEAGALVLSSVVLFSGSFFLRPFYSSEPENFVDFQVAEPPLGPCLLNEISKDNKKSVSGFCYSSERDSVKKGLIVGDSHANAIFPGFNKVFTDVKWYIVAHHSCLPVIGQDSGETACGYELEDAIQYAVKENFSYIVFSAANRDFNLQLKKHGLTAVEYAFEKSPNWMTDKQGGPKVILISAVPEFQLRPQQCLGQRAWFVQKFILAPPAACTRTRTEWDQQYEKLRNLYSELKVKHPGLTIFEPTNLICDRSICSMSKSRFYYADQDHLNKFGSKLVINALKEQLK